MAKRKFRSVLLALLIAAMALVACGGATPAPQPTPTPEDDGVVRGLARVDRLELVILESFPVQVKVMAYGNLPDGCTKIDQVQQARSGQHFDVTITTARPAGAFCTEALVPFEETISLDVYGLPAGSYSLAVNGVAGKFELTVDNK